MELIDLIFGVIEKFAPISQEQLRDLQIEAKEWRLSIHEKKKNGDKDNKIGDIYLNIHKSWFVRLMIAVLFIPIVAYLQRSNSPNLDIYEDQ
jgi:hypothetical protein